VQTCVRNLRGTMTPTGLGKISNFLWDADSIKKVKEGKQGRVSTTEPAPRVSLGIFLKCHIGKTWVKRVKKIQQ
jgi:hypothetical protein